MNYMVIQYEIPSTKVAIVNKDRASYIGAVLVCMIFKQIYQISPFACLPRGLSISVSECVLCVLLSSAQVTSWQKSNVKNTFIYFDNCHQMA